MTERLQKVLAQHGLGSRREIESWMRAGRVLLNGAPAAPGAPYEPGDRVRVDGRDVTRRLRQETTPVVLLYHKIVGEVFTRTAEIPATLPRLPASRSRWIPINRMSQGDSGLVLLTNDGRLANALMRRTSDLPATYVVRVHVGEPSTDLGALAHEVELDRERVVFDAVEPIGGSGTNQWLKVTARGADRRAAVRALFESQGLKVSRVTQVRFAEVDLPRDLPRGRHRALPPAAVAALYERAGLSLPPAEDAARSARSRRAPRSTRKPARAASLRRKRSTARRPA